MEFKGTECLKLRASSGSKSCFLMLKDGNVYCSEKGVYIVLDYAEKELFYCLSLFDKDYSWISFYYVVNFGNIKFLFFS